MEDEGLDSTYTTIESVPYVRLFVDHGESPVWAWDAVGYAELGMPEDLERRMRAWERTYHAGGWESTGFPPATVVNRHRAEGVLVALLLAEHLGRTVAVEFAAGTAGGANAWDDATVAEGTRRSLADPEMFHCNAPARNPAVSARIRWMLHHPFEQPGA
ncbi:hypothetical protein [Arthrobacter sp. KK5.5]|uniref:hypothetical protein n=1 Tax=Arthrobacter sp. KK5.5 TaxID=3373084 RepID=UPI003EE4AF49